MRYALAFVGLACLFHAPDAAAKDGGDRPTVEVLRKVAIKVGECVADTDSLHGHAVDLVLSGKDIDAEGLATEGCLYKGLSSQNVRGYKLPGYPTAAMRYLVANGLVRVDFRDRGPTDFSAVPPLDTKPPKANKEDPIATARALADQIGECTARVSPEEVRKLALTDAASDAEMAQVQALVPTFAQCLPPGVQLAFPPSVLRDASVLGYARLAYAQKAPR
jgi:hypothetical protein